MSRTKGTPWERTVATKIGVNINALSFTRSNVGQTLHVPCLQGKHVVDVHVAPNDHPDIVVKRMLNDGWTFGNRARCPEHTRKRSTIPKVKKPKIAHLLDETAPRSVMLSDFADKILDGRIEIRVQDADQPAPEKEPPMTRNERRVMDRTIAKAVEPAFKAEAIAARKVEQEGKPKMATKPELPAVPTDAARKAKRMVIMLLEEQYDDVNKRYRAGWDDRKISLESGAHIKVVIDAREEMFGPLGEPQELVDLRTAFDQFDQAFAEIVETNNFELNKLRQRLDRLVKSNGWRE